MKKLTILLTIIFLGIVISVFFLLRQNITVAVINNPDYYSFTKSICNENNYCQDFEITCKGNETVSIKRVGNLVQFPKNWKDPRSEEIINKTCE